MSAPGTDRPNTRVSIFIFTCGAFDLPEVGVVACEGLLYCILTDDRVGVTEDVADIVAGPFANRIRLENGSAVLCGMGHFADTDLSIPLTELHAAFGRSVTAGHYPAVAVGFVEKDFVAGPVDDSIVGGCFGQAIGLFVGEQWRRED